MILVDRTTDDVYVVLTLDGRTYIPTLFLTNDANQTPAIIDLGDNVSAFKDRYDAFRLDMSEFEDLRDGYYSYEIKEAVTGYIIEKGKLYIIPVLTDAMLTVPGQTDDIIILN